MFVVFFRLGDSPASELYVPTFQNTMFHIYGWCKQILPTYTTYDDGTVFRNVGTNYRRRGITQKKEYSIQNTAKV
jgi:hypothetical protein